MSKVIYNRPSVFHRSEFIQNKYFNWYLSITTKAKSENRQKGCGTYYEAHHILPESIYPEYSKFRWNLVLLTAREHFIVHHLLIKCTKGKEKYKMLHGLGIMGTSNNLYERKLTPRQYEIIRKANSEKMKGNNNPMRKRNNYGENNSFYGKKHSKESRELISKNSKGRGKGLKRSEETRKRISESKMGENHPLFKGYYITPEGVGTSGRFFEPLIDAKRIGLWCITNNNKPITKRIYNKSEYLQNKFSEDIIGKTFKDIGFYFVYAK